MASDPLGRFDQRRLRRWLVAFFLALAIPTAVLVVQAWRQLRWESFHQQSELAAELASRIDRQLTQSLRREDQRPFGDYLFLSAAGTSNLLQRSPLAEFPVSSTVPGLIGHFQVDHDGSFSSPLLPQNLGPDGLGIAPSEWQQRQQVHDRLRDLLVDNALVERRYDGVIEADEEIDRVLAEAAAQTDQDRTENADAAAPSQHGATAASSRVANAAPAPRRVAEVASETRLAKSQAAFDQLNQSPAILGDERQRTQVDDLQLDDRLQTLRSAAEQSTEAVDPIQRKLVRAKRKEQVYLPEGELGYRDNQVGRADQIATFQSELDPLEFSLLDSGHFVLFRKAWRDELRFVQGALLEQSEFLRGALEQPFRGSGLSDGTDLVIAFRGEVLNVAGGGNAGYQVPAGGPTGTLLHRRQLAPPLADIELLFTVQRLPLGTGAGVLGWSAALLSLVLCGGLYALYRLGLRQIQMARQQQDFVSAVSHELKTPLTSIRMYSEMLREGWADDSKRRGYYDFIHDESERLSRLIENVLQLARMTRNELQLNLQTVTVATVLDMLRSKVGTAMQQAGFELVVDCPESLLDRSLQTDLDCLAQVFINLIDNALKFSADAEQRQLDLTVSAQQDQLRLALRDYGPGIDKRQMKKIFRLFYRPHNELTRETAGTGIGLALVHQLVQALGGKIDLRNRDPGAEFMLDFALTG